MSRYEDKLNSYRMTTEDIQAENKQEKLEKALTAIDKADKIVIGGAAGLSAAGGIDYMDEQIFKEAMPALAAKGYKTLWEAIWQPGLSVEQRWAVTATELVWARFDFPVAQVYRDLLAIVKDKDYFVLTSNGDDQFEKANFDKERVFAPQGSLTHLQCSVPCCTDLWYDEEIIRNMYMHIDIDTYSCRHEDLPVCPHCGSHAVLNIRGQNNFIDRYVMRNRESFKKFIEEGKNEKMVFMEMGAGFNSPGLIRHPFQRLTYLYPQAVLLRFNRDYPKVPEKISTKSVWFGGDMAEAVRMLRELKESRYNAINEETTNDEMMN